ncbi:hypothetical protein LUZ60_013380 [Juncus effusus]|nr:hypothetical protein LUZ60_013380 [Juncus effusus]
MAKSNWYEPPYNPYFNVLNFGAIGDGKTDDSKVEGYIVAPGVGTWDETNWDMWLVFYDIDGLSFTGSGDDCISIGDMTSDVVIERVTCGPGHGISIGSLGKDQSSATVEEIHVLNSNFFNTTNGARIKTWQGGKGYAKSISFQNISLSYVENPIIIDQYYCTQDHCDTHSNAVEISDITYSGFWGTSMNNCAVSLNCSKTVPCTNIQLNNINITSVPFSDKKTEAVCINAYGDTKGYINPEISCLN